MANVTLMQNMVKTVLVNGKEVYVVVPNIPKFKAEAVEKMTVRPNKRRTTEGRFHWLLHTFVRETQNMKGKHMNVHLLTPADASIKAPRNGKGHYIKRENIFMDETGKVLTLDDLMANTEAVPAV